MTFVTTLDVIPGKGDEVRKIVNKMKFPDQVKIKEILSLFGKPDYIVIFEAPDEETAMSFILKFVPVAVPKTSLAVLVDVPAR
ncbi:MAG TPA: hypothetical protein VF399_10025 [bacterium]